MFPIINSIIPPLGPKVQCEVPNESFWITQLRFTFCPCPGGRKNTAKIYGDRPKDQDAKILGKMK